ncbi:hypothetical protein YQE_09025, partial [Dendroctonus ponderosae]
MSDSQGIYCDTSSAEIIPKSLRKKIFTVHGLAHPSGRATSRQKFVWPNMNRDIAEWSRTCLACQKAKVKSHNKNAFGTFPTTNARFEHIHLDIVGPLPSSQGQMNLLTMIDRFSRWPEAAPMSDIIADTITTTFYNTRIIRYGAPRVITSDQGSQFEGELFQALLRDNDQLLTVHRAMV